MPNFKEFIKGFEEKPEAKNPNPAPTPKPREVKMEEPKQQPKPSKDPMPFGMKRRMEDEVSVHNGQQPKGGQQMPKKDYSYLDDRELSIQMNLAENEEEYQDLLAEKERRWQESQKNKPQPKEGSFDKMMQGLEQPKMATEKKAEQYHEPKPKVELTDDEIYEELGDNEYWYKGKSKEELAKALSERKGISPERAAKFIEKYGTEYWEENGKSPYNPQPKEEPLFDEYQLSTKKGIEEAKKFLDAKGVKDIDAISNEQFNALADEVAKKYGISRMLAAEFLVAPYDEEISKPQAQPKQGSFEQVFNENEPRMLYVVYDTPQGQVGDYIELDPDMSEDDIIDQLKENENVVGVYGGATNAGAFDPKWVRE